jgi:hypothetical protein
MSILTASFDVVLLWNILSISNIIMSTPHRGRSEGKTIFADTPDHSTSVEAVLLAGWSKKRWKDANALR